MGGLNVKAGAAAMVAAFSAAFAAEPTLLWSYTAKSNLYTPPLVADVRPESGDEIIIADAEAKRLVCLSARGELLWERALGWKKRLISAPALSVNAGAGRALLAIANADGTLRCIDAATGEVRWTRECGAVEWGGALWADLDGDGADECVAGAEYDGLVAYTPAGEELWRYRAERRIEVSGPLAAADLDGDGKAELVVVEAHGPFALTGAGDVLWNAAADDEFTGAPVIADADGDGQPEVYAVSREDPFLQRFDGLSGKLRWKASLLAAPGIYSGSAIAVGHVLGNAAAEILVGDDAGHLHCVDAAGRLHWVFTASKAVHIAPVIADVDGDGQLDALAAAGDHRLYGLNRNGGLEWYFPAGMRLTAPATIADPDRDGRTDILFGGGDHVLRCITLGGRYDPGRAPWPSRRVDAAQSGSCFGKTFAPPEPVGEWVSLFPHGDFEEAKVIRAYEPPPEGSPLPDIRRERPRGWLALPAAAWNLDSGTIYQGKRSLHVRADGVPAVVASEWIELDDAIHLVDASIFVQPREGNRAFLEWLGANGILRKTPMIEVTPGAIWAQLVTKMGDSRPPGARWLRVRLETDSEAYWDALSLKGNLKRSLRIDVLVNQVGYDIGSPKSFVVQSSIEAGSGRFELVDESGAVVFSGALEAKGRIQGYYGNDWGFEYFRGAFSGFDTAGRYRVRVVLDAGEPLSAESWPFEIGENLLWKRTARLAYEFFYYQRCGDAVPGYHEACHLDDAVSADGAEQFELWGGWHDAGDYNTYHNAPYVYGLTRAYLAQRPLFDAQDHDGNGRSDFLDEIFWGADHSRRMIAPDGSAYGPITSGYGFWGPPDLETDNIPGTGDERLISGAPSGHDSAYHAASLALLAPFAQDAPGYIEAAKRALEWALTSGRRGLMQFETALALYTATKEQRFADRAREMLPEAGVDSAESLLAYDKSLGADHSEALRQALTAAADGLLAVSQNPFGVWTYGPPEKPNFFNTPADTFGWHVGASRDILRAAGIAALAYQFHPDPRYLMFAYDQFNWTLGMNPYNISLMEGAGSAFPPTYHHRYAFAGVARGAVPGSVVNGITWRGVGDDRPHFDMSGRDIPDYESNEVWLPHNTEYLRALARLSRAREMEKSAR